MCEALGVSRGGFYAWLTRPRSRRSLSDEVLGAQVQQSFVRSDRTYGARRCGTTCWSKARLVVCTASSGSCASRRCVPGPDDVGCPRTEARAARWPTTCWTASSMPRARTKNGWPTSPKSGRPRAGCTWRRCWTCTRGASWAGRCRRA